MSMGEFAMFSETHNSSRVSDIESLMASNDSNIFTIIPIEKNQCEIAVRLKNDFQTVFGDQNNPIYFASAPGRVNLIGEHIDYCGYSVLPMAIEKRIYAVAVKSNDDKTSIRNCEKRFEAKNWKLADLDITQEKHDWHKYVLCGVEAIKDCFKGVKLSEMNVLFYGDIPIGCGLSSSSALVVCAALITLAVNGLEIEKSKLAEACARCEKYIGTQGGGMDQAISCLATEGEASFISFNPLRIKNIKLPADAVFVIANSCTECHKAQTNQYNTRVAECMLASKILAKHLGTDEQQLVDVKKPIDVEKLYPQLRRGQLMEFTSMYLKPGPYTIEDVISELEIDEQTFLSLIPANTKEVKQFVLRNRLLHVWGEASRVVEFRDLCVSNYGSIECLGNLMNSSHESCSNLYECSSEGLDELVKTCREAGAFGSRMTGAGWGGCTVSLISHMDQISFLDALKVNFYRGKMSENDVLITKPSRGAFMSKIDN